MDHENTCPTRGSTYDTSRKVGFRCPTRGSNLQHVAQSGFAWWPKPLSTDSYPCGQCQYITPFKFKQYIVELLQIKKQSRNKVGRRFVETLFYIVFLSSNNRIRSRTFSGTLGIIGPTFLTWVVEEVNKYNFINYARCPSPLFAGLALSTCTYLWKRDVVLENLKIIFCFFFIYY